MKFLQKQALARVRRGFLLEDRWRSGSASAAAQSLSSGISFRAVKADVADAEFRHLPFFLRRSTSLLETSGIDKSLDAVL
jgi:hypothetical protein